MVCLILYTFEASGLLTGFDGFTQNGELVMEIDNRGRIIRNPMTGRITPSTINTMCFGQRGREPCFTLDMI